MDDFMKMLLFVFLGLIFAIVVLGYHASPQASPSLGSRTLKSPTQPKPSNASAPSNPTTNYTIKEE